MFYYQDFLKIGCHDHTDNWTLSVVVHTKECYTAVENCQRNMRIFWLEVETWHNLVVTYTVWCVKLCQGDPLLCDLHTEVTLEEIKSQIALEHGKAITVNVRRADDVVLRKFICWCIIMPVDIWWVFLCTFACVVASLLHPVTEKKEPVYFSSYLQ